MCDEDPIFLKGVKADYINHIKKNHYTSDELLRTLKELKEAV